MLGFIPRLRRKLDERNWIPIGEESRSGTPAFARPVTTARVDGPPDFALPNPPEPVQTPPPSYAQLRNVSRPEIASLLVSNRASYGSPSSPTNATPRQSLPPVMGSTLTSLEDIRHGQVINHVPMDNRLSSVPNYPVYLEQPPASRRRRSRVGRPASVASTTSTGLFLSMGQLPGSEPYDVQTSQVASTRTNWQRSQGLVSPLFSPDSTMSTAEAAIAHVVTVQRVRSVQPNPRRPPRGVSELSFLLDASNSTLQVEQDRCNPPAEGFYAPPVQPQQRRHPVIKQSHTWPAQRQSANMGHAEDDARVRFADTSSDIPPPPPPKDPGYVSRPPGGEQRGDGGLQKTHSSPNLLRFGGLHRKSQERSSQQNHHHHHTGNPRLSKNHDSPRISTGGGNNNFSNRRSHILNALGRLLSSRSVHPCVATG
jgi:hypothetical protein